MATIQTEQIKEALPRVDMGISFRAIQCARVIDRLRPGKYSLRIVKDAIESKDWIIEIICEDLIQKMSLARKDGYVPE